MKAAEHRAEAIPKSFQPAERVLQGLTRPIEQRLLNWLAAHAPQRLLPDHLTALAFAAQISAGAFYALSRYYRPALFLVDLAIAFNWFGDSLDGTLARFRHQERPRYGFYVDHITDLFGTLALFAGLAFSGAVHAWLAASVLTAFLLISAESFLAADTLARFELSQYGLGPTELRLLLMLGNVAAFLKPHVKLFGHRVLLLDLGLVIAAASMFVLTVILALRHTTQLRNEETYQ